VFELFFKYPVAVFRNGRFVLLAGWPLWALVLAVGIAGLLWAIQIFVRGGGALGRGRAAAVWALQTATAVLVLVLLWRPAVQVAASRPQQNVVAVMVDASQSMALADPGRGPRFEAVRRTLAERLLPALTSRYRVRLYTFSGRAVPVDGLEAAKPDGRSTRLGESLASVVGEGRVLPLAAVVVLSDGADNAEGRGDAVLDEAAQAGIPVHTVGVGRTAIEADLELEDVRMPSRVAAGSRVLVSARIRARGFGDGRATLRIRDGAVALATREVALRSGREAQTEAVYVSMSQTGGHTLTVSLDPLPGEEVTTNNRRVRAVEVVSNRARILYVEGEPRWELKFIRRAVEDDRALQLVSYLRASANKVYRQGVDDESALAEGFPSRAEDLFAFDALVLGSIEAAYFTPEQQALLKEFVSRRGGAALWLGGRQALADGGWAASPAADVLPVRLSARAPTFERRPARAQLTVEGRESPLCLLDEDGVKSAARWAKLPELADFQRTGELKPGAVALLNAVPQGSPPLPLLVTQSYGRGEALVFATGGSWRWRMRLPHDDVSHATFWQQLLRGLVAHRSGPVLASTDRSLYADEDRVSVRAEVRTKAFEPVPDASVWATVIAEDGAHETFELRPAGRPGLYDGTVLARAPGTHRIEVHARRGRDELGQDALVIRREDGVAEGFHPEQDAARLRRLAERSGGRYWTLDDIGALPDEIAYSGTGITVRETLELWDMPAVFLAALLLRTLEWLARRGGGRV
jgi:uncharacterized membrane protein